MPPKAKEIDALKQEVVRKHLDALKQIAPPEQSTGAFTLDRGYLNENNEATPLGNQYLLLLDNGLMDENGELTEEGRIYSKTQKEAVYGRFDDYDKRERLGLNQLDKDATKVGFGDSMLSMGKQFVTESIPAMFRFMSPNAFLDPLQQINDASTLVKSSWLSLEPLATGAYYKASDVMIDLSNEDADQKEKESLRLKQEYERNRYDYDSLTGADFLTALSGGSTIPNQMRDLLIKQKGEEYVTGQEQAVGLVGSFIDPTIPLSMGSTLVAKSFGLAVMRSLLNAEKQALKFSVLSTERAGIRSQMAALESALSRAEGVGAKVTEKASAFESVGKTAESVRYKATAARIGDSMQDIKGKLDELAAVDSKISTDLAGLSKKAGVGDALIGINNKIQQFKALPANAVGQTVETIGNGLMKADAWLDDIATRTGIDGVYNTLKSIPGLSAGLVLGPAAAVPTIGARILASGPFLESVGKYTKILGKELMQARGSSSYWQRVANNPTISNAQRFLSHRMDELTLGGYLPEVVGSVAKGTAASYPMNLAIEYLQDPYGDPEDILNRAAGASLVFGGGFSGVTQMFKGSKETLKAVRIGDELNFTRNLLESQKAGYNSLGKGSRRMVSSFAAAFPNLNWDFVDGLPSRYDPVTNTVRINPKSNNPLRPLIAHEVGHYISIRNGANPLIHSMLLGDAETPGILRKTNGELDPEFQRFKDEYDKRTDAGNIERRSIEDIAEEYFIENTVDHMVEMVESGELSKMTGRTQAGRQLRKFIQATMPRVPILKDFFFRSGGAMQAGGKFVEGNGLLAEGLRELPEAKAMMRNLIRDTAGEASSVPRGKGEKGDAGNRLPVQKGDPIVDSFHSILESDANGQPLLDKDGDHIPLSRATDEARQAAGLVLIEEQIRRVNDGYMPEDGEIKLIPDKGWQGRFISPATINALAAKGILNAKQIAILRNINTATRQNSGTRYMVINHPATIKRRGGKIRYASIEAALRETVPVGFSITKTGNVLVHLMSVDQLHKNVTSRAASKRGQALYQGNPEAIKQDISAMMDMHATNTKTDKYYQDKYGPKWEEHQRFINTIFGQMTKEQRSINPMFDADKIKDGNVYRTFRLDRISKATKMDGTPIPFNYDYVKVNYFPDGVVDKSEQMPEQMRQMPEEPITSSSERWKSMSNKEKDAYVFTPAEMTPSNKAEFDARVESGSLSADTPVVDINRSNLLTSRYGPPSSSATGNINTWIDDNTGKPVAVAFSENGNIPTKGERNQTPRQMPEASYDSIMERYKETPSTEVSAKGRVYSPIIRDLLQRRKAGEVIPKSVMDRAITEHFPSYKVEVPKSPSDLPSQEKVLESINSNKRKSHFETMEKGLPPEGEKVTVRQDVPAMTDFGVGVVTTTTKNGKIYRPSTRIKDPVFVLNEIQTEKIGMGEGKAPHIVVNGKWVADQSFPKDLDTWTQVGFNPDRHSYYYERGTNKMVVSGEEALQIGNTVFVKKPDFGDPMDPKAVKRYMPEPVNPAAPNVAFKRPLSRTDSIPDIDSTLITDSVDINEFAFDRPAKVYMELPNKERLYFNYDPAYLIKPEFKDLRKTLEGKNVIILEADRMRATGGDMGGPLHPFLRSNQVVVKGSDGKMYKAIWANMTSTFVTGTKNRWFNDDAQYALIHIMDENAHASNKRIARAINEAWKKANLPEYDQRVIAIAMQAAITSQEQSMLSTKITQAKNKIKSGDLTSEQIKEYEGYITGWLKERNKLAWAGIDKEISSKISKIKTAQTRFKNKNGTKDSIEKAKANLKEYLAAKPEHLTAFNELSNKSPSFEIADNIGKTFQSRGAAIKGLLGIEAGKFNPSDILSKTEDFKGGENMDIVGAVQLSKNKDIFAVYFGNDPKEEAAMSNSERQIRDKLRADPNFVEHEAFDWMMLGPEDADNFIADSFLKPEELLPDYRSKHPKASVKDGSEETVLGAMKKNADIPLSVKKYTPTQIKQIQENRKIWIAERKAKEARKKQIQSLKAKIKQRDASITKLDKMLTAANETEASAIVAKQAKAESEKKTLADQIKALQSLN